MDEVGIDSQLSSISAFSTNLKRYKTFTVVLQPIGQAAELNLESKFEALQVIWQSLQRRQSKVLTAKSMGLLLGPLSSTA